MDREGKLPENPRTCSSFREWGTSVTLPHATTASTVKNCEEICKQGTVWAVPAPRTDMVFLEQKLALLLLVHPISLFTLMYSQSPCFSCNLKSTYLPNPHAKLYLPLSIPHSCCCCNTHYYRSELTAPRAYSFLLLIFLDKNQLSGLIDSYMYSWLPLHHLFLTHQVFPSSYSDFL